MARETEQYTGWFWEWREEWSQFFQHCNWRTFHPFLLEIEDDRMMGGVEMNFMLMGLGFQLRWNYAETEVVKDIKVKVDDLMTQIGGDK